MAPTLKREPPTPQPDPAAPRDAGPSIARLERQIKWLIAGLVGMFMLVIAMGAFTFVAMKEYAAFRAQQVVQEQQQLQLLHQIQSDFDALEMEPPRNPAEAYGQLQEYLGTLRDLYGPMAEYDITDPDGSLDRIFESLEESQRQRDDDE